MGNGSDQTFSKLRAAVTRDKDRGLKELSIPGTAFNELASSYDEQESENPVFYWMRQRVWDRCLALFRSGDEILELNCGTGIDAAFLASNGLKVYATDASEEMTKLAKRKLAKQGLGDLAMVQQLDFHNLSVLRGKIFSGALSNFGGLNCTNRLETIASDLASLLKPGSFFVACVMSNMALWEVLWGIARRDSRLLLRRFHKDGVVATLRGNQLRVYYHSPARFIRAFSPNFELLRATGLGLFLPPPHGKKFVERFPALSRRLLEWETVVSHRFPFTHISDHTILELRRI